MDYGTALHHALGYAAGREDSSGTATVSPTDAPGFLTFGEAYAAGWDDMNTGRRHYMTNARDAYDTWQSSAGRTIFRDEFAAFDPGPRGVHVTPHVCIEQPCPVCRQVGNAPR